MEMHAEYQIKFLVNPTECSVVSLSTDTAEWKQTWYSIEEQQ